MEATEFIKASLNRSDPLFRAIYAFNFSLARYIHKSFLDKLGNDGQAIQILQASDRVRVRASDFLLNYFNLNGTAIFDFSEPHRRLALIDGPTLETLCFRAGAVIFAPKIGKLIKKEDVARAKKALGDDLYFYANKRAALVQALVPDYEWDLEKVSEESIKTAGRTCLEFCLQDAGFGLHERLKLKFPASTQWNFNHANASEHSKKAWGLLKRLLFKEVQPQWQPCFT